MRHRGDGCNPLHVSHVGEDGVLQDHGKVYDATDDVAILSQSVEHVGDAG